ncbi:hypothetical protein PG994_001038 [Apiospora phragmitis]|uniref:Uncharacterized protein n=1 Tax=Apiospora phragmitis TaxID=2905665 RepID=A0ABR1WRA7_9PEZI
MDPFLPSSHFIKFRGSHETGKQVESMACNDFVLGMGALGQSNGRTVEQFPQDYYGFWVLPQRKH